MDSNNNTENKGFKNNNELKLVESKPTKPCNKVIDCHHHEKNVLIRPCGQCGELVCQECIKEHDEKIDDFVTFKELADTCKQEMLDQVKSLQKQNNIMTDWYLNIDKISKQLTLNRDLAKCEVDKTFEKLHRELSGKRNSIFEEIDDKFQLKYTVLEKQKNDIEDAIKSYESVCKYVNDNLDDLSSNHAINDGDSGVACEESFTFDNESNEACEKELCGEKLQETQINCDNDTCHNIYLFHQKMREKLNNLQRYGSTGSLQGTAENPSIDTITDIKHNKLKTSKSCLEDRFKQPRENAHLFWKQSSNISELLDTTQISEAGTVLCCRAVAHKSSLNTNFLQDLTKHCIINCEYNVTLTTKTFNGDIDTSGMADISATLTRVQDKHILIQDDVSTENTLNESLLNFPDNNNLLNTSLLLDEVAMCSKNLTSTPKKSPSSQTSTLDKDQIQCLVNATDSGLYDITFRLKEIGQYCLEVKLYGEHVENSPFIINGVTKTSCTQKTSSRTISKKQNELRKRFSDSEFARNPIDIDQLFRLGTKGRSKGEFANPQDVAISKEGRYYVTDSNNQCVQVFEISDDKNEKPKCVTRFGKRGRNVGQILRPTGIAILDSGHIAVSDYDNKIVNIFTEDGKFCTRIGAGKLMGPRGICVNNNGNVIVADNKHCKLFIFQPDGKLIRKFGSRGIADGQLAGPHYVAVNQDGEIFVTDFYNHCVKVFTARGVFLRSIGSQGEDIGQFNGPTGISIDSKGHVIVADWGNNRLQVFDQCGLFIGFIKNKQEQLYGPQGVTTTQSGFVAVADSGNHCVKVYRIKQ